MKKIVTLIMIFSMIMVLAACSKSEDGGKNVSADVTKAPETTKEAETTKAPDPTKEAVATPEPTKEAETTPEPTKEAETTPEPTADVEPAVTDEIDDGIDEIHTEYEGLWRGDNDWLMTIIHEGEYDPITVFTENTDMETFGNWHKYWTNLENNAFTCSNEFFYHYGQDGFEVDDIERENTFEVQGDKLYWVNENVTFTKITDESIICPMEYGYYVSIGGDDEVTFEPFGLAFENIERSYSDLTGLSYYGYYLESANGDGNYYPYKDDVISYENMDEFDCAFIQLGWSEDEGQFCFLEEGINEDISWTIKDEQLVITGSATGNVYYGDFWLDHNTGNDYIRILIDGYSLWLIGSF